MNTVKQLPRHGKCKCFGNISALSLLLYTNVHKNITTLYPIYPLFLIQRVWLRYSVFTPVYLILNLFFTVSARCSLSLQIGHQADSVYQLLLESLLVVISMGLPILETMRPLVDDYIANNGQLEDSLINRRIFWVLTFLWVFGFCLVEPNCAQWGSQQGEADY